MAEAATKTTARPNLTARPLSPGMRLVSVVSPAFRETENLPVMYRRLVETLDGLGVDWEWVIVDDHSPDNTFRVVEALADRDSRVRGLRLSRNSGSHTAIACGLQSARGECAIVMASDLQDPPETIPALLAKWRDGYHVVWAVRAQREGEGVASLAASGLYYWLMRHFVGMKEIPATGADFMLMDRVVVDAFNEFKESTLSILALITWLGFEQTSINYQKAARMYGTSGWRLRSKLKLVVDSITSFSYAPIRLISYGGIVISLAGFAFAAYVVWNALTGAPVEGWSSLMVVLLVVGGMQMMMMGVLGVYVWRALDEARSRPRFIVERTTFADPR